MNLLVFFVITKIYKIILWQTRVFVKYYAFVKQNT